MEEKYLKKTLASESVLHERDHKAEEHKPMSNYDRLSGEDAFSELFGLKSSFDDISVGADAKGRITVSVSSEKELHSPTLTSERKRLRGSRKRRLYEHFGELYTNSSAPGNSAFAYKSRKVLSENRILSEFRRAAYRRLTRKQREMAPFLTLYEDRRELSELRSRNDNSTEAKKMKGELEQSIVHKKDQENRFLRKLRIARRQTVIKPEENKPVLLDVLILNAQGVGDDDTKTDDENNVKAE